ncbi:MAG: GNAT family N-acetyltransferase [Chloroflexi bacterium]|nr:MAG: GNAT family N-acetyltransferase [Chloroflexota bacterium]MBL1194141.1 GNAT family N-acetyltransferase [Chloroflexota bacterium]NOH11434.1 GNAT family N-acetyltransferase [Chloroflexota bacterium]
MTITLPNLVPASQFSVDELTDAYNQTRVDYLVPMPMNAARLQEYIRVYDLDLEKSFVAKNGERIFGLGMLGLRPQRSWITRLGVLPNNRRHGIGEMLMEAMLEASDHAGIPRNILEVIKGNTPGHHLFKKMGFTESRELVILRRPPSPVSGTLASEAQWFSKAEAIPFLDERKGPQAWTNETESLQNVDDLFGMQICLNGRGQGWLVFQKTDFNLSRLMFQTKDGDPEAIMLEMLAHLHSKFPKLDTYTENIPADDPHLLAFSRMNYINVFERIEMCRKIQ